MPDDLLLPAFLLTLVANAVLVAVAIRALTRNRAEGDHDTRRTGLPAARTTLPTRRSAAPLPAVPMTEPPPPVVPTTAVEPRSAAAELGPPAEPAAPAELAAPAAPTRRRKANARSTEPPPGARAKSSSPSGKAPSRADTPRAGRRRFSLPPLDDDHERVSRSIQSFLSGADLPDAAHAAEAGPSPAAAPVPTTIAVVAIHGLGDRSAPTDPATLHAADAALATVERTLRSAARTADRVTTTGPGRYRVILPATGELAARAYLRRVRATVDPSLEVVDAPLVLLAATTTVLDEPIAIASARAEARLHATMAGLTRQAADLEPRVAGD